MNRLILARVVAQRTACANQVRLPDDAVCHANAHNLSRDISPPLTPAPSNPPSSSSTQTAAAEPLFHFIGLRSSLHPPPPPPPPSSALLVSNCISHSSCRSELRPSLWRDRYNTRGGDTVFRKMIADAIKKTGNRQLTAECEAYMQAGGTFQS
jgi:hypothetical protein